MQFDSPIPQKKAESHRTQRNNKNKNTAYGCRACFFPAKYWESITSVQFSSVRGVNIVCRGFELVLRDIVSVKQKNVVRLSLNLTKAYFTCESTFWLPDACADGGGTEGSS